MISIKKKMLYVENSVNSMFEDVKFKLFAEQINGGEVAICDTLVSYKWLMGTL